MVILLAIPQEAMLSKLLVALALMALCVVIHATGLTSVMRWLRLHTTMTQQFWPWTWLFIRVAMTAVCELAIK